ncbi:sigma-70 family RNA polymerase sigma factor [Lentisphaera profundi]|uniref:Sigma-70 family RNA polymerase sigma factor n=1 Tax=Lentisphaera profundi TaxID=1658616 RepID=A0ABY7VMU3_9BACT|nr:sigma-70 family RNA polymerase sigma factor [Lentisphaera profundi]WDE95360.1 sigma-70 family RNA polymerase sigma factor [Lentisphaera profundi]
MKDDYSTSYTLLNRACSSNDSIAWDELIGLYKQYIYVIIRSMNISQADADDVQQQVLLQLWKYLPSFDKNREGTKFRYWLSRVTRNQAINFLRKQKSYESKLDKAKNHEEQGGLDDISPDLEERERKEWELFISNKAMDNIREHFSEKALSAFALTRKGLKPNEISSQIGVSADSVYKYVSRIKLKLIEEIKYLRAELDF